MPGAEIIPHSLNRHSLSIRPHDGAKKLGSARRLCPEERHACILLDIVEDVLSFEDIDTQHLGPRPNAFPQTREQAAGEEARW